MAREREIHYIENTAGDVEREACSRRFNAIEALGIYTFILAVLWGFGYVFGVMRDDDQIESWTFGILTLGAVYLLIISPRIHRDTLSSWGLGGPAHLRGVLHAATPQRRWTLIALIVAVFVALNVTNYLMWHEVADFLGLDKVTLGGLEGREWVNTAWGLPIVVGIGSVLAALIVVYAVRYDNFLAAFGIALRIGIPLALLIFFGALIAGWQQGTNPFAGFSGSKYALGVFGYVFWGFIQQLLFTAYLGTRFRKAFGPSPSPTNRVADADRWRVAAMVGLGLSLIISVGGYTALRIYFATQSTADGAPIEFPLQTMFWFFFFSLPICLAYGYIFTLDKRRLVVATLASSCFAFIHIDSYGLVGATWLLGTILIYVSMEDRYRNLVALGFIHGLLGSTFGEMFSNGQTGALEVDYSVGPWGVETPTLGVLLFPGACIFAFAAMMFWFGRSLPGKEATAVT